MPVVAGDELSPYWPPAPEAAVLTNYTLGIERHSGDGAGNVRASPPPPGPISVVQGRERAPTHFRVA